MHVQVYWEALCIYCAGKKANTQAAKAVVSNFSFLFSKEFSKGFSIFVTLGINCTAKHFSSHISYTEEIEK